MGIALQEQEGAGKRFWYLAESFPIDGIGMHSHVWVGMQEDGHRTNGVLKICDLVLGPHEILSFDSIPLDSHSTYFVMDLRCNV